MPYLDQLYYDDRGSGPPLLLLHCPAVSHLYWQPIVRRLASHFRCISVDIRGHGRSGQGPGPWSFADIAGDLTHLSDHLNLDRPALVGYSAGGAICLQAALDRPERFGRICMVSSFSECNGTYLPTKTRLSLRLVRWGLSGLVGRSVVKTNHVDKAHARAMLPEALAVRPEGLTSFLNAVLACRLTPRLPTLLNPVLLLYGARDLPMHRYGRTLRSGLPAARLTVLPGVDHRIPTQLPDLFCALLERFLGAPAR